MRRGLEPVIDPLSESCECQFQRCGQPVKHADGRLLSSNFDKGYVGSIQLGTTCKIILSKPQLKAACFDLYTQSFDKRFVSAGAHAAEVLYLCTLKTRVYRQQNELSGASGGHERVHTNLHSERTK